MKTLDRVQELAVADPLTRAGVRVWQLHLTSAPGDDGTALLADGDRGRLVSMLPSVRARLLARRALVGQVAGDVLGCDRTELRWDDHGGRPFVEVGGQRRWLSLSSASDVALLAISDGVVGLDVELAATPMPDASDVATTFFTTAEAAWVGADRRRFLAMWVRKEAVVKATGEGMSRLLDSFVVDAGAPVAPVRHTDGRLFGLQTVALDAPGLVAAVAVPG